MTPEFREWPKIHRLNRTVTITEKIDGTNACVIVPEDPADALWAQSRKRIITPESDNYGFAAWVQENAAELRLLGPGYHYGEWYGRGIQRNYGLDERRFALFNAERWTGADEFPECCEVVPILSVREDRIGDQVDIALQTLRDLGSIAVPGWQSPEGVVVHHHASRQNFKVLLVGDQIPKGVAA